ncbi:MAG: RNA-binding domain-containing protein [Candidatus Heimdallarchaeota archaeon]
MPHHKKRRSLTEIVWVELAGSVHATENLEKVLAAFQNLLPPTIENTAIKQTAFSGHHGNPVIFLNLRIEKTDQIFNFLTNLVSRFSPMDKQKLTSEFIERIDKDNIFYMKVDKQKAYLDEAILAQGDNIILIKIKFKQYIKNFEKIKEKLADLGLIEA